MAKEISPALTREEWSGEDVVVLGTTSPKLGYFVRVERPGMEGQRAEPGTLSFAVHGPDRFALRSEELHTLAAVALYGQEFGFTWEMVRALESTIALSHEHAEIV